MANDKYGKATVSLYIDEELVDEGRAFFGRFGLGVNNAASMLFHKAVMDERLPFAPSLDARRRAARPSGGSKVTIWLDADVKDKAKGILGSEGLTLTSAVAIFIAQCVLDGKVPFRLEL